MTIKQKIKIEEVLTTAHNEYGKSLGARAFFKVGNRALSEDLVQTTFMKTWLYLVRGGKIEKMKSFLYHILNNLIVDEYRKHKTTSLDNLIEKGFEPSSEDMDDDRIVSILDGRAAFSLMKNLPSKYYKVMRMRFVEGLSPKEMSQKTGQSKNSVSVQIHRGIEKLKRLVEPV